MVLVKLPIVGPEDCSHKNEEIVPSESEAVPRILTELFSLILISAPAVAFGDTFIGAGAGAGSFVTVGTGAGHGPASIANASDGTGRSR